MFFRKPAFLDRFLGRRLLGMAAAAKAAPKAAPKKGRGGSRIPGRKSG